MSPRPPVKMVHVYRVNQILSELSLGKYWLPFLLEALFSGLVP